MLSEKNSCAETKVTGTRALGLDLTRIREIPLALGSAVRSKRFALAAFLVPLFIRSIPEILVGPYPIGWDTIAFYVPNTLDCAVGKPSLLRPS
ncbi:hypothetical protein E6H36_12465 [Candidatus Bathyarchaeota archaeon]|nr:MAG: hypothetical protein E6H36_12465 [Candidatus Bathyarchaeota archaeon]